MNKDLMEKLCQPLRKLNVISNDHDIRGHFYMDSSPPDFTVTVWLSLAEISDFERAVEAIAIGRSLGLEIKYTGRENASSSVTFR